MSVRDSMKIKYYASALILAHATLFAAEGPSPGFSVTLHAPDSPVKTGAELRLKATITNTSDHEIRFAKSPGVVPDEALSYQIDVRDPSGQEPPITPFFREVKEKNYGWGSYTTYFLEPGKSFDEDLVITRLYSLKPGNYNITVTRAVRPMWQIQDKDKEKSSVKSNTVTVTVGP